MENRTTRSDLFLVALFSTVCTLGGCSKPPSNPTAATTPQQSAATAPAGTACDRKLLTAADADGILSEPITGSKNLKGDAQTCYFITASEAKGGPSLMITLRPGLGTVTLGTYSSGKMNEYATWKPLSGIGDEAVWLSDLHEVVARKNDLLCNVRPSGTSSQFAAAGEAEQQKKLGALCNKIFAVN